VVALNGGLTTGQASLGSAAFEFGKTFGH